MDYGKILIALKMKKSSYRHPSFLALLKKSNLLFLCTLGFVLCQCTMQGPEKIIVLQPGEVLVQEGDTVYHIARRYQVPVKELIRINRLESPYILHHYDKLVLPKRTSSKKSGYASLKKDPTPKLLNASTREIEWRDISMEIKSSPEKTSSILRPVLTEETTPSTTPNQRKLQDAVKRYQYEEDATTLEKEEVSPEETSVLIPKTVPEKKDSPAPKKRRLFISPVNAKISQKFGQKDDKGKIAKKIIFSVSSQTPVVASGEGVVMHADKNQKKLYAGWSENAYVVILEHDNGYITSYGPLDSLNVSIGQKVSQGTVLGKSSQSTLFMEMRQNRQPIDPLPLLQSTS